MRHRAAELRARTLPGLLAERARATPHEVAYRAKRLGVYEERHWKQYAALAGRCALALERLGLQRGERVAIMGDACEEWVIADLGAQAAGAITYGIYPTASAAEVEYQLADGGASLFIAENQEYVDKVLPLAERLPGLRAIVVIDDSAMFAYRHAKLHSWRRALGAVALDEAASLAHLEALAARLDPLAGAFIVYTSGTTGPPKGALVSHGRHLAAAWNIVEQYPTLGETTHRTVVYLPLCHIFGRDVGITLPLLSRLVPHFGEDVAELPQTLAEVEPTVLFSVPRYLQKIASTVLVAVSSTSPLKRLVYDAAMRIGRRHARKRWEGAPSALDRLVYGLARLAAFRPILLKLGLDRVELAISGGAALPPETAALWQIWGMNLVEAYGQTEASGAFIAGQRGPFPRPGAVGTVPAGWEVRLARGGEILVRSPDLFDGYWGKEEATREVLDGEGWLHTGDVGEWRDGELRIVDRARDFMVTSGGKTLSPSYIESLMRSSPYVGDIAVFGHGRKYVSALIEIDFDTVSDWARAHDVAYSGFTSLAAHPAVTRLIDGELERLNEALARVEQIKAFRILPKALDPEDEGEPVTPTRKIKRKLMYERYRELVEAMYDNREERLQSQAVGGVLS
ncbi:MAG TPA: AMP-binding protein [Burkholderiales bacterium]|nr:AMP-binding protein [Burkholderiales bacterium]